MKSPDTFCRETWNTKIAQYPAKTAYHTYEWLTFVEKSQNVERAIYEIIQNNRIVGVLPGFVIKKGPIRIFGSPFPGWTTPYLGPLLEKGVSQELFFQQFKRLMGKEGYHYAELSNRSLDPEIARQQGFVTEEGVTYIASIKSSPEEILASYSQSPRYYARRAMRNPDLSVETTTSDNFLDHYYALLEEVFEKSNMRPTYSKERVRLLIKELLPSGNLILTWVKYKGAVAACYIDIIYGDWLHSFGCVSARDYLEFYPNELARFHVMCTARERGALYYDMTGGGTYKARFGAEKIGVHRLVYSRFGLYKARNIARKMVQIKNKVQLQLDRYSKTD